MSVVFIVVAVFDFLIIFPYVATDHPGISKEMTREELAELFKPYGEIIQSKILVDQYTGFSKGAGFILFR